MLGERCSRPKGQWRHGVRPSEHFLSGGLRKCCCWVKGLGHGRSVTNRIRINPDEALKGRPVLITRKMRRLNIRFPGPAGSFPSSVTVNVTTSFCHRRWWQHLSEPSLSPSPPFFLPALAAGSVFHTWRLIARVKVFSASVFPRGAQRGGGGRPSAAGFTEKIAQNCLIPEQISDCTQSRAKCYCALQFGHYTLSFPFRDSHPIKEYSPPVPAPIKSGRYYLPWWSRHRSSASLTFISSIHCPPSPHTHPSFLEVRLSLSCFVSVSPVSKIERAPSAAPALPRPPLFSSRLPLVLFPGFQFSFLFSAHCTVFKPSVRPSFSGGEESACPDQWLHSQIQSIQTCSGWGGGGVLPSSPVNTNQCLCPFWLCREGQ